MLKTTEKKLVLSAPEGEKITQVKIADDGKSVEIIITAEVVQEQRPVTKDTENFDDIFPIIDPSELVDHRLLEHEPKNPRQERILTNIRKCIDMKMSAFRSPCMDPSEENGEIVFKPGNKPAVGHSAIWWDENCKKFMPSKNSRIGTDLQWAAFLGKLMKCLVDEKNYSVADAWKAVCNDSCELGHYMNSKEAKFGLESTKSRKVGEYFDLANTFKILKKWDDSVFLTAGGDYQDWSYDFPLADFCTIYMPGKNYGSAVGWLVLDI